jgi:hypothetical protein
MCQKISCITYPKYQNEKLGSSKIMTLTAGIQIFRSEELRPYWCKKSKEHTRWLQTLNQVSWNCGHPCKYNVHSNNLKALWFLETALELPVQSCDHEESVVWRKWPCCVIFICPAFLLSPQSVSVHLLNHYRKCCTCLLWFYIISHEVFSAWPWQDYVTFCYNLHKDLLCKYTFPSL